MTHLSSVLLGERLEKSNLMEVGGDISENDLSTPRLGIPEAKEKDKQKQKNDLAVYIVSFNLFL